VKYLKSKRGMSTYNVNIDDCAKNQFPIELIFIGNQIFKGVMSLAKTTAGIIILLPIGIASLIILPITYFLIGIVFAYYIFCMKRSANEVLKVEVDKDSYAELYDLYLKTNKAKSSLDIIEYRSKTGIKGLLLRPILFFIKKMHIQVIKVNNHFESQLFKAHNPDDISIEDIEYFKAQLKPSSDDWNDDELWKDFQIKHHHLAN